jgi:hypothetical protein
VAALRLIRKIALGFVALVFAYLVVAVGARLWPLTPEERAAIGLMERPLPPVAGRDGSDAGWLQDHDVPAAERAAVARTLREYYLAHEGDPEPPWDGDAVLDRFPKFEGNAPLDGLCGAESDCLADVRANPAKADAILMSQPRRVAVGIDMANYDGLRYGLGPSPSNPIMPLAHNAQAVRLFRAREFVAGRRQEALAGVCRDLAGWRRISADADTLINNMISLAMVRHDAVLLADMLAQLPAGEPLPAICADALAPTTTAELDACPMFRAEFGFASHMIKEPMPDHPWYTKVGIQTLDQDRFKARLAKALGVHCSVGAQSDARADRSVMPRARATSTACSTFRWAVDPMGCMVSELSPADAYAKYADRRTDVAAVVAGARTIAWLREQAAPASERARVLAARPASLGLRREPRVSADGRTLAVPLLHPWQGQEVVLKLGPAP